MTGRRHHRWAAFLMSALVAASCSKQRAPAGSPRPRAQSPPIATSSPPSPAPTPLFDDPIGVAVDGQGNVWVANYRGSTLQMFGATDVHTATGQAHPVPKVVLSGLGGPNQLEFDRHGRLWLAQWDDDSLVAYVPSQLLRSGSPTPAVRISGAHLSSPTDLAVDRSGSLWAAQQGNGEIVQYTAADLDRGGQLRPKV